MMYQPPFAATDGVVLSDKQQNTPIYKDQMREVPSLPIADPIPVTVTAVLVTDSELGAEEEIYGHFEHTPPPASDNNDQRDKSNHSFCNLRWIIMYILVSAIAIIGIILIFLLLRDTQQSSLAPPPFSVPAIAPSVVPSSLPSAMPSVSSPPSSVPSSAPSSQPTDIPTSAPSARPSSAPSMQPTSHPSIGPSIQPTSRPSNSASPVNVRRATWST